MKLDHVNVRVRNLTEMCQFYEDILRLKTGYRPAFPGARGAWLYDETGRPVLHLSTASDGADRANHPIDHIAFRTDDITEMMEQLESNDIAFQDDEVPEIDLIQVFFYDPEGGRVEVSGTKRPSENSGE